MKRHRALGDRGEDFLAINLLLGNSKVEAQIRSEVEGALRAIRTRGSDFVVNDSIWFWQNPAGKIRPTVVNSAKFITGTFQRHLESIGWEIEKKLDGQDVDAYKAFEGQFRLFTLPESRFLELLSRYEEHFQRSSGPLASSIYVQHCLGSTASLSNDLKPFQDLLNVEDKLISLRVAIEFETGNIASSFRAANKLDYLYRAGEIDLGVFLTSNDKANCAARIWPVTNRNGSFQELERRGFAGGIGVPLWQIGFAPDEFDSGFEYLAGDGTLYAMENINKCREIGGVTYELWRDTKGQERLRIA
jgi:hypothetical protein